MARKVVRSAKGINHSRITLRCGIGSFGEIGSMCVCIGINLGRFSIEVQ
jgi:hypothetical protein